MRCIERHGVFYPFTLRPLHICKINYKAGLEELVKEEIFHLLHIVGRAVLTDDVDLDSLFLHYFQVCVDVILTCFEG